MELNKIYNEDCLEGMKQIPDKSVDMILCDLPYEIINSKWDKVIDFEKLWEQYERIIKDKGAIVLTAKGYFTYKLIASNEKLYRYKWVWLKNNATNFINAKNKPMTKHEDVLVFSKGVTANGNTNRMNYYPQGIRQINRASKEGISKTGNHVGERPSHKKYYTQEYTNYPNDVLQFALDKNPIHPTQKPVSLFEYLIRTYSKKGETVLDTCMGSGTTAVACVKTGRNYIGFELDETYYKQSVERVLSFKKKPRTLW